MNEPIRILHIVTHMNRGGLETMLMNYYRNIDREKIQFDFLTHRNKKKDYDDEIISFGGKIFHIPLLNPFNPIYLKTLNDFFKRHKEYKIVHSHLDCMSTYPLKYAKKNGVPTRIAHSHISSVEKNTKLIFKIYSKKRINKYSTKKFSCSMESGIWMFGESSFGIFKNAINAESFRFNVKIAKDIRKNLGIEDRFVIGHIGGFRQEKNHDFLIDIFAEIFRKNKTAILLLAGTGNLEHHIKTKVSRFGLNDAVKFLGVRKDVNELLQAFDVFLFPSLTEGLPVTIIEAQAAGLKCFISDKISKECCITENVEIISLKSSPKLWAEQIIKSSKKYERKDLFNEIEKAGYDIKKNAQWLEEFYLNEYRQTTTNDIYTGI